MTDKPKLVTEPPEGEPKYKRVTYKTGWSERPLTAEERFRRYLALSNSMKVTKP